MVASDITSFREGMLQKILELEVNDGRFEDFSREAVSIVEGGCLVLPTSKSWDLGRDGVGVGRSKGIYVCSSLRDDVDIKSLSDIERLVSTTSGIEHVYFCSSQNLSEHRISKIEGELRSEFDFKFSITCLGSIQLAYIANRDGDLAERSYGAELKDCYRSISSDVSDEAESKGLRLALMSAAGDNSQEIRDELYSAGLLDELKAGGLTLLGVTNKLSVRLKLSRSLPSEVVLPHLGKLESEGLISKRGEVYLLTELGSQRISESELAAASRLLVGRAAIRDTIENLLGAKLLDNHFNKIWSVFEDRMAHYFTSRGDAIVLEISTILSEQPSETQSVSNSPYSFLDELARAVADTSSHPQQREELCLAIKDMFMDRSSVATEWLVKLAASFIAVCALGLEYSTGAALSKLFARTSLVIDTDVSLSLLCEGEPEHEAVFSVVTRWIKNRGKVLVGESVLEEAAYHAYISQRDYDQVKHLIPGEKDDRLHIIENAFVRAFAELVAEKKAKRNQWEAFISQYRGMDGRDWSKIFSVLSSEYSIDKLPARSSAEEQLENNVRKYLTDQADAKSFNGNIKNARDKARRDAELYSALVHHVKALRGVDPGATCLLVSSARRLVAAEAKFHQSGEPQLVVSISAILYMLAMLPSVSLGVGAMRVFLFDERRSGFSSELERTLLRMIKSSHEVSMPFAKRGLLMRSVRGQMIKDASQSGQSVSPSAIANMEAAAFKPANEKRTIEILKDSLDELAIDTRTEKENRELRAKVAELEKLLQSEKSKGRRT
ncbi:hypothetical protein [Pseudomonas moraviensis]